MKTVLTSLLAVALIFAASMNLQAQEEKKKQKKGNNPTEASLLEQTFKAIQKAEITAEQETAIKALIKEIAPKIVEAQTKAGSMLTNEQKKARGEALKKAREEGLKGKAVQDAANAALNLSEEEAKKYKEAVAGAEQANKELKEKVMALLTEEQRAKLGVKPKANGEGKGKNKKEKDNA